jgi:hypothetical protein
MSLCFDEEYQPRCVGFVVSDVAAFSVVRCKHVG